MPFGIVEVTTQYQATERRSESENASIILLHSSTSYSAARRSAMPRSETRIKSALFQRTLRNIEESELIPNAALPKALSDICGNRNRGAAKLARQSEAFVTWKFFCFPINAKHRLMRLLPNQKITKGVSPSHI
jgi:hypothetical protein